VAPPFKKLTVAEFRNQVATRNWLSKKSKIHVHHTWRPKGADFKGEATIKGMYNSHVKDRGFTDIAQHISIDPGGFIWTGRPWDASPASAVGYNSTSVFMFETIGDFDKGQEPFAGPQKWAVFSVCDAIMDRFGLSNAAIVFHNEMSGKTCPGSSISKPVFLEELKKFRNQLVVNTAKLKADPGGQGKLSSDDLNLDKLKDPSSKK
jgi:N-acetylmuramoyl-L-alanine amidase